MLMTLAGMNVKVPGQVGDEDSSYGWFLGIVGVMAGFCVIAWLILMRAGIMDKLKQR